MEEQTLSHIIADFIAKRKLAKLTALEKDASKHKQSIKDELTLAEFEIEYQSKLAELQQNYDLTNWLDDASKRAKQTSLVTHALKFAHPDAKGTSIFYNTAVKPINDKYLCSQSLDTLCLDAVGNAAALDVASFLQLEHNGSLIANLARGDDSALRPFALTDEQLQQWVEGFKQAIAERDLSSHTFAKQIYFPVSDGQYHLVSPLYPTSLTQVIHEKVINSRFSEESKSARKAKREKKYSDIPVTEYPNIAKQNFGGTKPQNISQLNSGRGGKAFLFNCAPPNWNPISRPPVNSKSIFKDGYGNAKHVWRQVKALKDYLISISLKASNKTRRDKRAELIDNLIDELFNYAAEIQNLREHAGWSVDSSLPKAQQLWLDPLRVDDDFQEERATGDWQSTVAAQFADWLNHKIRCKKLIVGDAERLEWKALVDNKLRQLKVDLEGLV